ncbi:adenylate kinase [Streptomyces sp. NBC_01210]|uniref:adenylate kinase n=1 Tax=Streptomyces sp. NBC_01210 TaxID=2903774 RepID=UPI002E11BF7E|nr:adenylate kinase [Streptomyces sp. NBC_01210]
MHVVLIGPPGFGKGTQARHFAERLGIPSISSGDLFRAHFRDGTLLGRQAKKYMDSGALVPDHITMAMVKARIAAEDAAAGFLLDGFPRNVHQAVLLDGMLAVQGRRLDHVLALKVSTTEVERRLAGRRACQSCNLVVNVNFAPPRVSGACDTCGGRLIRREGDRERIIRRRLAACTERTAPLLVRYAALGILANVDAVGPVEDVRARILAAVPALAGAGA